MLEALSEPGIVAADNVHQTCYHQKKQASGEPELLVVISAF